MYSTEKFPNLQAVLRKNISGPHSDSVISDLIQKDTKRLSNSSLSSDEDLQVIGGILDDGSFSWLAKGPVFIAFDVERNTTRSVFNFNRAFPSLQYNVTTCTSCGKMMLIGLRGVDGRGMVVVFNPYLSKVVRAIDVPYAITTLAIVSLQGGAVASSHCLAKNLRWLFGIVAVGTEEGHLYLIDLRLDSNDISVDKLPSQMEIVPPVLRDVPKTREAIIEEQSFLAYELQATCHEEGIFHFAFPDNEIIESFYPSDTNITTMLYEPRVACLFVGFSFGQFQIFSLQTLSLVYSSEIEDNMAPILKFAFQEPENDPRNHCFLWIVRGGKYDESIPEGSSEPLTLSMFQLVFFKKEILAKPMSGPSEDSKMCPRVLYKTFEVCNPRFQHTLGTGLMSSPSHCFGSTLLMCSSMEKYASGFDHQDVDEDDIEYCLSPSSSLCLFAWQSPLFGRNEHTAKLNMIVFDINRWYMAHMPPCFRGNDEDYIYSAYWAFHDAKERYGRDERILGIHAPVSKMHHFESGMKPHPERFLLPSACSFSCDLLTDQSFYRYSMYSYQQQVLNTATELKSMCLVNPQEMHASILSSGLYSRHNANHVYLPDMMREDILTTALEHGQISFLLAVVRDLASGHLAASGCTLRFMVDWAWKSVTHVKDQIDKLCVPIFDCTCPTLDSLVQSQLNFHSKQIHHLKIIFQRQMEYTENSTEQGKEEMNTKLTVVTLIHQYLKVVQWFIGNGLLPEQLDDAVNDEDILSPDGILIYKYSRLRQLFDQRRAEIARSDAPELLLIDGWVEEIGEAMTSRWLKEEGGRATYPPPSFMTLLDMYYLDCIDLTTKHCLVMYLLLDVLGMFSTLEGEDKQLMHDMHKERLNSIGSFLHAFAVPTALVKLTQGFWLLDHKNFEDSLSVFLDADTSTSLNAWQERRILRSFLYQGHPSMALKYISTRNPKVETIEDAKMHITIYVKCREPLKAWNLVKLSSSQHNMNELFLHLFTLCQQNSQLDHLLKLPFSPAEEELIIKYLRESNSAEATQILILFHLQHSRYVDAIKLHSQNKHIKLMRDQSDDARRRAVKLDHIVQSYTNLLPNIEKEIYLSSQKYSKRSVAVRREVHKPGSLSAVVRPQMSSAPLSCADRLTKLMDKMDQDKANSKRAPMTPFRRKPQPGFLDDYLRGSDMIREESSEKVNADKFVYPTVPVSAKKSFPVNNIGLFRRRSSFGGSPARGIGDNSELTKPLHSHAPVSRIAHSQAKDRRYSNISVASMLLQTPPITRRRHSVSRNSREGSIGTPHSILKVKLFNRNLSPSLSVISQNSFERDNQVTQRAMAAGNDSDSVGSGSMISVSSGGIRTSIPTISTPSAKVFPKSGLKKLGSIIDEHQPLTLFETPKKIRFQGVDTSGNDSIVQTPPVEQVAGLSNLTPILIKAEDTLEESQMDVDITGEETGKLHMLEDSQVPAEVFEEDDDELHPSSGNLEQDSSKESILEESVVEDLKEEKHEEESVGLHPSPILESATRTINDDEVICLDSSSDEDEREVQYERKQEEEAINQDEDINKINITREKSLRLVLTSSEESLISREEPEELEDEFTIEDKGEVILTNMQDALYAYDGDVEKSKIIPGDVHFAESIIETECESAEPSDSTAKPLISDGIQEAHPDIAQMDEPEVYLPNVEHNEEVFQEETLELHQVEEDSSKEDDAIIINEEDVKSGEGGDDEIISATDTGQSLISTEGGIVVIHDKQENDEMGQLHLSADEEELSEEISIIEQEAIETKTVEEDVLLQPTMQENLFAHVQVDVKSSEDVVILETDDEVIKTTRVKFERDIAKSLAQDVGISESKEEIMPGYTQDMHENAQSYKKKLLDSNTSDLEVSSELNMEKPDDVPLDELVLELKSESKQEGEKDSLREYGRMKEEQPLLVCESSKKSAEPESTAEKLKVSDSQKPSTPIVTRVREEPTFVLSPPTTRRSTRKSRKVSEVSPEAKAPEITVTKSPSRITRQSSKQMQEPEFLFSPPTTKTRSTRSKVSGTIAKDHSAVSSPPRSNRKTRSQLIFPEQETDQPSSRISPVLPSKRKKSYLSPTRRESSPDTKLESAPTTPSRRMSRQSPGRKPPSSARQPPGRKPPSTPTRSSSRVRKQLVAKESDSESQVEIPTVVKKTRRKKTTTGSDVASSGTDGEVPSTPVRRSLRSKSKLSWSPSQDKTRLIELTPLPEEDEEAVTEKKRKKEKKASSTRVTRSTASSNPVRMRRKAKVFTLEQ